MPLDARNLQAYFVRDALIESMTDQLMYENQSKQWYIYNRNFWESISELSMKKINRGCIVSLDPTSEKSSLITDVMFLLAVSLGKEFNESDLPNQSLINFQNGVFDIRIKQLLPHAPEFIFTNMLHLDFSEDVWSSLEFQQFLLSLVEQNC